jgi:hypothetical protein
VFDRCLSQDFAEPTGGSANASSTSSWIHTLQAMTNDSDLNMGNDIGKRDTQFFGMFWLKTLEN